MKRAVFLAGFMVVAVVCIVIACSSGGSFDCDKDCTKEQECSSSSSSSDGGTGGSTSFNMDQCKTACEKAKDLVQQAFLDAQAACDDKACSERSSCTNAAYSNCTKPDNYDSFVTAVCAKVTGCEPSVTAAACQAEFAGMGAGYLVCLTSDAVGTLQTCLDKVQCSTFSKDFENCLSSELGIDISSSTGGGGDL